MGACATEILNRSMHQHAHRQRFIRAACETAEEGKAEGASEEAHGQTGAYLQSC